MAINSNDFRVRPGTSVDLSKWATSVEPLCSSKQAYKAFLEKHVARLSALQELHYASDRDALLIIFQGMDAAGKDGAIRHVMSGVNPQGVEVFSFKTPSAAELKHDFLWRSICRLPERGRIGIFNRSYYEEVLMVRVHPELLRGEALAAGSNLWRRRYRSIVDLERHLAVNGTRIVKCFLHLSREEQRRRLLGRIDDPRKNWKLSESDIRERQFWNEYMKAYGHCLGATSTRHAPWYVVPADHKDDARLITSRIILDSFEALDLAYPKADAARQRTLQAIRRELAR